MILVNLKILANFRMEMSFSLSECESIIASKGMLEITSTKNLPRKMYLLAIKRASYISTFEISSTIVVRKLSKTSNPNRKSMIHVIDLYPLLSRSGGLNAT